MSGRLPSRVHWLPIIIGLVFVGVAAVILLLLIFPASFGISSPSNSYRYGPFGGVFFLLFLLIVAFFIVRVAFWSTRASRYGRRGSGRNYPNDYERPNRPAMVARMRYARGEITREQYDQIMNDLTRRPGSP